MTALTMAYRSADFHHHEEARRLTKVARVTKMIDQEEMS
jgi:hypothetical protein